MSTNTRPPEDTEVPFPSTKRHPYIHHNSSSSTTFQTSLSSFTQFAPTLPSQSQTSLGHSIKARYPDPYSENPFLPLKELRRLRSTEYLTRGAVPPLPPLPLGPRKPAPAPALNEAAETMSLILGALTDSANTPALTPNSAYSDEELPNVDFSPTSSNGARPYTSYFARGRSNSIDSEYDELDTPADYRTAVSSDMLQVAAISEDDNTEGAVHTNEQDEKATDDSDMNLPEPTASLQIQTDKAQNPCTPARKRPPPIRVGNQGPRFAATQIVAASPNAHATSPCVDTPKSPVDFQPDETFITVQEEEEDDDIVASPCRRSVKLSDASAFSLSLFPPTPTTPMNRQGWVRNGRSSMEGNSFSSGHRMLGSPIAFSTPRSHPYRSVPPTPTRRSHRATMSIDREPRPETLLRPGRASIDAPRFTQSPKPQLQLQPVSRSRADTSSDSSYSQSSDSASFYSDAGPSNTSVLALAVEEARGHESSYMRSESAFETCIESRSVARTSKDMFSQSRTESCEDVLSTRVLPPTRKPVPQFNDEAIEMTDSKPRVSLPDPNPVVTPSSPSPISTVSFNSLPVQSGPKAKKRKKIRNLIISHPHINDENLNPPPTAALSEMTLPIGPKVTYSNSIGSLRDELLGKAVSLGVPSLNLKQKKRSRKIKKVPPPPLFDKYGLPDEDQLRRASEMYVYDENSRPVRFGDIFKDQKTAICFIRHFWCPLCQDYMSSIVHLTEPSLVEKAGVKLVIIGNGSPGMIKSYKTDIFKCPYEMYTDPDRELYSALGMTLRTTDAGSDDEKGSYVKHGTFTGTMLVLKRALKMPLANAGDIKQLGGEFILGPGLNCSFASRMHTTRSHTPIRNLLQAAGVSMHPWETDLSILHSPTDSIRWTDAQNEDMNSMIRKGLQASCGEDGCSFEPEVKEAKLGIREFRRLIDQLKEENSGPVEHPTTYLKEVMGESRTELDELEAVVETRGKW
ncbi:unnamed protein product [Rhizoctonia solani]|uniref:Thioredoxin-like protein AAED1 n=1 Tax=Rhizoctonia solani TaxID=456999 RepID=A0A8H3A4G6_9AGAM|nr:unnamed protein product [Rhizoctonia solani]